MKWIKLILLLTGLLLCNITSTQSQCNNLNFSHNNLDNWVISTGYFYNCCPTFNGGDFTVIANGSLDSSTCSGLFTIPPGFPHTLKIGNSIPHTHADRATYSLNINSSNCLITVAYAIVFQNPNHFLQSQPKFEIRLLDSTSVLLDSSCSTYNIIADSSNIIFNKCSTHILWTNWVFYSIDLTSYIGQTITIDFTSFDCAYGGHFGYAYITANCSPRPVIKFDHCFNDSILEISAPINFKNYLWSNGATTRKTLYNIGQNYNVSVTLTSFMGCTSVIDTIVPSHYLTPDFYYDIFCDNDTVHFYDLSTTTQGIINKWDWDFGDGNTSTLKNPSHKYDNKNTHLVNLKVSTNYQCCKDTAKYVTGLKSTEIDFSYTPETTDIYHANIFFIAIDTTNGVSTYHWNFANLGTSNYQNVYYHFQDTGSFDVTLTIINNLGCLDSIAHVVVINDINTIYIPAAFTPNGDGLNDLFKVYALEVNEYELEIYNRWGSVVFYSKNINDTWDGKGAESGVYVYKVTVKHNNLQPRLFGGTLTLIR